MKPIKQYGTLVFGLMLASMAHSQQGLEITKPWIRMPPPGMVMMAGYGEFTNASNTIIELVAAHSDSFESISFHISEVENGISRMREIESVLLRPGETVYFEPGGKHLMISSPTYEQQPEQACIEFLGSNGQRYPVDFIFSSDASE